MINTEGKFRREEIKLLRRLSTEIDSYNVEISQREIEG